MRIHWQDRDYEFDPPKDLTLSRLRLIKSWFPGIGTYLRFVTSYGDGDPDALACVMWLIKTKAGESCPEPVSMTDFAAGDFWIAIGAALAETVAAAAKEASGAGMDPTEGPSGPSSSETREQDGSTPTSTSSGIDT